MMYVAIGRLAGTALEKSVSPVVVADDNLLIGPSRVSIDRHRAARARHWGSAPSQEVDQELVHGSGQAICVALPPTLNGLLTLGRICSGSLENERDVHVLELGAETLVAVAQSIDPVREVCLDVRRATRRLPPAVRWARLQTSLVATLWRLWCRRSPVAFSRLCGSVSVTNSQMANMARYHAGLFPRVTSHGLCLSRLDELILRQLSRDWLTPARMYASAITGTPELGAWLSYTGDLFLAARLLAWSNHTQGKIVERRKESPPSNSDMLSWSFRWCAGAEGIIDALSKLKLAPPMATGGAVAYDPERPWACRLDATGTPYITGIAARAEA